MRAQLVPLEGGTPLDIAKDLVVVGRKDDCDLFLDHKSVSKMHCVLVKVDGLLVLRDLGSTNGTRVNGQRVRRATLLPNDHLHIASLKFKVEFKPDEPSVGPDERTQHLDAKEVQRIVAKAGTGARDSSQEVPAVPIRANALPDVYPESADARK